MMKRQALLLLLAGAAMLGACESSPPHSSRVASIDCSDNLGNAFVASCQQWATTYEGQRQADLGDGTYLNPIMAGDHPDPSILKKGENYYMVFSTFESYPALTIWHSTDMVNWEPVGPALKKYVGSIWAPELTKHDGRYYVYIPAKYPGHNSNYVVWADRIEGPWSDPIDLDPNGEYPDRIDPGHLVGEDGNRYLFFSHGDYVQLSDDGLSYVGQMKHVYDGWRYPQEWDVESYSQEGPKMMKRGDYFYMTLAVGGTAGPPTGHMVISARSKSVHGPWENSPYNPIVRTESAAEKWWSRGHATVVEGPTEGDWYMMYHGYENGFYTLGRQTLMEPIEWLEDDWFVSAGFDVGKPIPKPEGATNSIQHGMPLSDDFSRNKFGIQWSFFRGDLDEHDRLHYGNDEQGPYLKLEPKGDSPSNGSPMTFVAGDQAYQFEVDVELTEGAQAGAMLFYNDKLYAGVGVLEDSLLLHRYGMDQRYSDRKPSDKLRLRVTNDRHILTIHYSYDKGKTWHKYNTQMEVSGYHHNVAYGFMSLRPALYAAGDGAVIFRNFNYRALN